MAELTMHSQDSIDVGELATFTHAAYRRLPIPFKHGETLEEITTFLEQKCPDSIVLARAAGVLLGWAGLYMEDAQANLLSWHPLVTPPNPTISEQLVRACIQHTATSGKTWMEVLLLNLTPEYRDYAAQCGAIYQAAGMGRRAEWQRMEADVQQHAVAFQDISDTLALRPLSAVSQDELWPCFDAAFSHGVDQHYAQRPEAQRRETFDALFNPSRPLDDDASLALFDGERLVGFVEIGAAGEDMYVNGIGVIPAYRRQGLARYMLGTSMQRAAANQCRNMILYVDNANQAALGLYKSLGFQNVNQGWISYLWEGE